MRAHALSLFLTVPSPGILSLARNGVLVPEDFLDGDGGGGRASRLAYFSATATLMLLDGLSVSNRERRQEMETG